MITQKEYKKYPEKYWLDKKVTTLCEMQNGNYVIPAGTILIITRKYDGFSLRGVDVCSHCKIGVKISIARVPPNYLELMNGYD